MRAAVSGFDGILSPYGSGRVLRSAATVGSVASRVTEGLRSVSIPWPMNTADSRGRAILRINMTDVLPSLCPMQTAPADRLRRRWGCSVARPQRQHHPETELGDGSARPC